MLTIVKRNYNSKLRSDSFFGLDRNSSVHQFNNVLRDRKTETCAAILVVAAAVFLFKGIKDLRDEILFHSDACILYRHFYRRMIFKQRSAFNCKQDVSRGIGKLDGIGKNVNDNLLQFHVIADVVVAYAACNTAFIMKALLVTLQHYHVIDLLKHIAERELFFADDKPARFDAAHVENIIDESEQMSCASSDLFEIFFGIFRQCFITQCKAVKPDDRIHRSAYLMAHAGEECSLRPVGLFCSFQCFCKRPVPVHRFTHFLVDDCKSQTDRMNDVIVTVLGMALTCHADHLVVFFSVSLRKITVDDYKILC